MQVFVLVSLVLTFCHQASGHGRLMEPPSRSSAWRAGFPTPPNYDDNQLYCGGRHIQDNNDGKCGVCGDPWNGVRANEAGGKYATGTIVRHYTMGQIVTVKIDITANHWGWFEFKICPNNDVTTAVTHACLNRNPLQLADGSGTRYMLPSHDKKMYTVQLKLPPNMVCTQCVLQWRYHAANSYGVDTVTGRGCVGCGPQEEFYGCADVAIEGPPPTTTVPTTMEPDTTTATKAPVTMEPDTTTATKAPATMEPDTTTAPVKTNPACLVDATYQNCIAIGVWRGIWDLDMWCTFRCARGHCPPHACLCSGQTAGQTTMKPITAAPSAAASTNSPGRTDPTTAASTNPPGRTDPTTAASTNPPGRTDPATAASTNPPGRTDPTTAVSTNPPGRTDPATAASTNSPGRTDPATAASTNSPGRADPTTAVSTNSPGRTDPPFVASPRTDPPIVDPIKTSPLVGSPLTTQPDITAMQVCRAIGEFQGNDIFDQWCTNHCSTGEQCPADTCACVKTSLVPIKSATTTRAPTTTVYIVASTCSAKNTLSSAFWNQWCQDKCNLGVCPVDVCNCL